MPQNLQTFDAALKETYGPGLRNAVNDKATVVWAEACKNTDDLIGEEAVWAVHSGRSNSTGARGESTNLPVANNQRHLKARKGLTFQYHTIKVSGPAKHLTRGDEGAFARALETEIKGAERDIKNDMARQAFGQTVSSTSPVARYTGVIGTVSSVTSTTLLFAGEDESIMRHFFLGESIQVFSSTTGTIRAGGPYEITGINKATRTVTVGTTLGGTVAATDWVARGDAGSNSLNSEIDGLRTLISPIGSYAGLDPANTGNASWASLLIGSATTGVSEVIFDEAAEVVETDGDGNTPELFVSEFVQRRKLASLLQAQKRYDGREVTLTSGWKGLQLARGTLVADRYCPTTYAFGIHQPELTKFVGLDFQWDEDDGTVLYKSLDGQDSVEARYKAYVQLAVTNRNSHVQIRLSAPSF